MRKSVKVLSIVLALFSAMAVLLWTGYSLQAKARGAEVTFSFLPVPQWGFGVDDSIQEASFRTTRAAKLEKPHDQRRRLGFIEVRERRWMPLSASSPARPAPRRSQKRQKGTSAP